MWEGIKQNEMEAVYHALLKNEKGNVSDRIMYVNEEGSLKDYFDWIDEIRKECTVQFGGEFIVESMSRTTKALEEIDEDEQP